MFSVKETVKLSWPVLSTTTVYGKLGKKHGQKKAYTLIQSKDFKYKL